MIRCSPVIVREDFLAFPKISWEEESEKERGEGERERERGSGSSDIIDLPSTLSPLAHLRSAEITSLQCANFFFCRHSM